MNRGWARTPLFLFAALLALPPTSPFGAVSSFAEEKPGAPRPEAQEERQKEAGDDLEGLKPIVRAFLFRRKGSLLHAFGEYDDAIALFRRSIAIHPTAEAHTFLGWSLSMLGRYEEAIAQCEKAIPIDPDFGNPYNDIGVYLIALGRAREAEPWLRKAMRAKRYCCRQFPHFNLGRIYLAEGRLEEAGRLFERALEFDPDYIPARQGLEIIRARRQRTL